MVLASPEQSPKCQKHWQIFFLGCSSFALSFFCPAWGWMGGTGLQNSLGDCEAGSKAFAFGLGWINASKGDEKGLCACVGSEKYCKRFLLYKSLQLKQGPETGCQVLQRRNQSPCSALIFLTDLGEHSSRAVI